MKVPGQLSLWKLLSVLHPPWDQSPGRRVRSKSSSGPCAALSDGPNVLPFPAGHWAEAEGAQWAVAGAALQRQAKAFPTGEQRGYLKGGGHKSGKEGTGRFSVTSETQQANTPLPHVHLQPLSSPSGPDHWVKTSKPIPAFWGEKKKSATKRGGDCLLRNLVGSGPGHSHHRRLKTRLTVRMMPRRRTNGSQVFTKAPTLTYFPYSRQKKQSVTMFQLVLLL